jgi:hypothetical protein
MNASTDPAITITLPWSVWQIFLVQMGRGIYADVAGQIAAFSEQAIPQLDAAICVTEKAAVKAAVKAACKAATHTPGSDSTVVPFPA